MPRRIVSESVIDEVRRIWWREPELSGARVHARIQQKLGSESVSLRKVQQIVAELREGPVFRRKPWNPWEDVHWGDDGYAAEEVDYLLEVQRTSWRLAHRELSDHEVSWAGRLRVVLQGLDPKGRMLLIWEYSYREEIAFNLERPLWTDDLDALLTYKPWLPENRDAYRDALSRSAAPVPPLFISVVDKFRNEDDVARYDCMLGLPAGIERVLTRPEVLTGRVEPPIRLRSNEADDREVDDSQ